MVGNIYASTTGLTQFADNSGNLNLGSSSGIVQVNGSAVGNSPGSTVGNSPYVEGTNQIGCVMSSTPKSDPYFGFSSSGPYTTFYDYNIGDNSSSSLQAWHMATGDGYPDGTTQYFYSGTDTAFVHRKPNWAVANRLGVIGRQVSFPNNQTSYTGVSFLLFPVRNTTGSPITRTFYWAYSQYWSAGYEGAAVALYTPNATTYAATSGGTWSSLFSTSGSTSTASSTSFSVAIPAGKTCILMACASWYYYTSYQFYETNCFYNLSSYMDSSIICDQRMLATLAYGKISGSYSVLDTQNAYTACANLYGNR